MEQHKNTKSLKIKGTRIVQKYFLDE